MIQNGLIHFKQFPATFGSAGRKAHSIARVKQGKTVLDWIYPFQEISSNSWSKWQESLPPGAEQGNFLDWIQHISGNFSATFCSIGRNSLQSLAGKTFKLDSSVSGNLQELSIQVAETPSGAKYGTFLDWIYLFQAISSNFGFRLAQKAPSYRS